MDETESEDVVTVGQRLRDAREAKGLSIEDIAAQTRIPTRHLSSLETSDWDKLPAPTYSVGFAKNYATAVGLDRNEIGEQLRAEMGGERAIYAQPEVYEAADPARTMPKGLVIGAILLLVVVVLALTWMNNRKLESDETVAEAGVPETPVDNNAATEAPAPAAAAAAAAGPVVLTATEAVWFQVKDGSTTLKQGQMAAGETYQVPASATAPTLTTGKPEALRITVGTQQAQPVGQPGRTVSGVSLKAADLIPTGTSPAAAGIGPEPTTPQAAAPAQPRRRAAPASTPAEAPNTVSPAEGNSSAPSAGAAGETAATQ